MTNPHASTTKNAFVEVTLNKWISRVYWTDSRYLSESLFFDSQVFGHCLKFTAHALIADQTIDWMGRDEQFECNLPNSSYLL